MVEEIIDQWYGINGDYFKVLANDNKVYLIKYNRNEDLWTLEKIVGLKSG